jgi:hypothetical protein
MLRTKQNRNPDDERRLRAFRVPTAHLPRFRQGNDLNRRTHTLVRATQRQLPG